MVNRPAVIDGRCIWETAIWARQMNAPDSIINKSQSSLGVLFQGSLIIDDGQGRSGVKASLSSTWPLEHLIHLHRSQPDPCFTTPHTIFSATAVSGCETGAALIAGLVYCLKTERLFLWVEVLYLESVTNSTECTGIIYAFCHGRFSPNHLMKLIQTKRFPIVQHEYTFLLCVIIKWQPTRICNNSLYFVFAVVTLICSSPPICFLQLQLYHKKTVSAAHIYSY